MSILDLEQASNEQARGLVRSPSLYPHLYEAPLTGPKIKLTGIAERVISFDDSEKASVPILFGDEHKGFHLSCNRKVKVNCG